MEPAVAMDPRYQQLTDEVRQRYGQYVDTPAFTELCLAREFPQPTRRYVLAAVLAVTIVLLPIGLGLAVHTWYTTRRARQAYADELKTFIAEGHLLLTYMVIGNSDLFEVPGVTAPALVAGSFDPRAFHERAFLPRVTQRLQEVRERPGDDEDLAELFADESFIPDFRLPLPDRITDGLPVSVFHVVLTSDYLPGGELSGVIPFLAEPGDEGHLEMVPWDVFAAALAAVPVADLKHLLAAEESPV